MTFEMTKPAMTKPSRLMLTLCAAALLGVAPFHLSLDPATGLFGLTSAVALADGGSDDKGGDSSDDGAGHDANDDSGGSGSDDGTDDQGSGDHSSDDGAGHHAGGDDSLPGGSTDDGSAGGGSAGGVTVVKFESNRRAMEVVFSDGTKEEITDSHYERKDAQGRTVEERPATQADVDRLWALR